MIKAKDTLVSTQAIFSLGDSLTTGVLPKGGCGVLEKTTIVPTNHPCRKNDALVYGIGLLTDTDVAILKFTTFQHNMVCTLKLQILLP